MLSILIPTYNYDIQTLVDKVHAQLVDCKIKFEILCYDDCSTKTDITTANKSIAALENTQYKILDSNIGRSAIRNLLAKDARFDLLLFLDADVIPVKKDFISTYLKAISKETKIVYGGILYPHKKPNKTHLLRWVYGKKREALSAKQRKKNTHLRFLTLNFIVRKGVFKTVSFNEKIPNLRHEDTLFSYDLKQKGIDIEHIDNPVYHCGIEDSKTFLKKTIESHDALNLFLKKKLIAVDYTKITKTVYWLKKYRLDFVFSKSYPLTKKKFEANLLSNKPSLFVFDLYRLSYLCYTTKD